MAKRNLFDLWVVDNMKRHGSLLVSPKSAFLAGHRAGVRAGRKSMQKKLDEARDCIDDLFREIPLRKAADKNSEKLS